MATQFRHHNSPEEVAKREGPQAPEAKRKGQGFRHYNSPEEVAAREARAGRKPAQTAPRPRTVVHTTAAPADWPPAGEQNNAPAGPPVAARQLPPMPASTGTIAERVQRLEALVLALVDNPGEAKQFRARLSDLESVVTSQRTLGNRLRAVEQELQDMADEDGQDGAEGDDDEPEVEGDDDAPEGQPDGTNSEPEGGTV